MNIIFGANPIAIRRLSFFVSVLIFLPWLQIPVRFVTGFLTGNQSYQWEELVTDIFLSGLFTLLLILLRKKISVQMSSHVDAHTTLYKKNPQAMWVYDLETLKFLSVNNAAIILYGYNEEEFLNLRISDIRPEEDVPALINATDEIRLNFNEQYHWSGTWRHRKKNGELIYVDVSSHEIIFEEKKAELVLVYDITDQVMQDQKLQTLNQDLERKVIMRTNDLLSLNSRLVDQNKVIKSANLELFTLSNELQEANLKIQEHADLKNRFVAMASHEFRTPLANIAFSAGFIRHHFNKLEPENIIEKIKGIESHVAHMAVLLDDVLTIGKSDAVKLEVKRNSINLTDFITLICQEVQIANNDSHHVHLSVSENTASILQTDEKFLRNIFINLLNNAIKYSPGQKEVYVNVGTVEHEVHFKFIDKGIGINSNELEKIFEPFYRIDLTHNIQGTGLGLSIVKRAADLLGARVQVQSEPGRGSAFTVILPAEFKES